MKYTTIYILVLCLIFTLFTGCGDTPETSTDVKQTSSVGSEMSMEHQKQESTSSSVPLNQPQTEEELPQSEEELPQSSVSDEPKNDSRPTEGIQQVPQEDNQESNQETSESTVQTTDAPVADTIVEYPTFTGETSLKNWLIGNYSDYFSDKRSDMLSTMGNKGNVIYYRPSIPINHSLYTLSQVNVHTPSSGFSYYYNDSQTKWNGISVYVNHVASGSDKTYITDYVYDNVTAKYNGEPSEYLAEGVEVHRYSYQGVDFYYYIYDRVGDDGQSISVSWLQFNTSHMASVHENLHQIEEIIPLLYLQQVKLDNSAVIK